MKYSIIIQKKQNKKISSMYTFDVTSYGSEPFVQLSPFYPHGDIQVPLSPPEYKSKSVEGIWQGLKVFEHEDIDISKFFISSMRNIKRRGIIKGHRNGVHGDIILSLVEARKYIYLPAYKYLLEHKAHRIIDGIKNILTVTDIVLLDFSANDDIYIIDQPLSHAGLVRRYIEGKWQC